MEPVEIKAGDLLLRPWHPADADAVHRACQDPDIQRWIGVPHPYEPTDAIKFVTEVTPAAWADGTSTPFAVCDAATDELLGSCGLVSFTPTLRTAEIGYWTAPWARGRGVAARAVRAVARWSFEQLELRRLIWQAEVGNHASRLVALRAGFRVEGQLRLAAPAPGARPDGWIGSLLPADLLVEGEPEQAGPGTMEARRAGVFGRAQPVLCAATAHGEIRLRPMEERDLDAVVITCQDPETVRWTTVPDPYQRSDAEGFLEFTASSWARATAGCFVIADPDDNYAGSIDLRILPTDPLVGDVGFMTAPHARGRGYQTAALAALTTWGFTSLDLARIEWRANVGNRASRRVAEKAGFVFEGTARGALRHRGERVDTWIAALLADDLAATRNLAPPTGVATQKRTEPAGPAEKGNLR